MENTLNQAEEAKARFREYLLGRVVEELSGRTGEDIIEKPSQSIFAGILQPVPQTHNVNQHRPLVRNKSSLGMEFRIIPDTDKHRASPTPIVTQDSQFR